MLNKTNGTRSIIMERKFFGDSINGVNNKEIASLSRISVKVKSVKSHLKL